MRVLLTDGSGLTSRQVATQLSSAGHVVEVLSPDRLCLTRFTRHVRRVHRVPPYGADAFAWMEATLGVFCDRGFDVLFPTQEQVAVLSREARRLRDLHVATAVPRFEALARVQDKLRAFATLGELGLPQPDGEIVTSACDLALWERFPVFVKTPVGTATTGVRKVLDAVAMQRLAAEYKAQGVFGNGGVLVQSLVRGELAMAQSVFAEGQLVAFHANLRVREGVSGGASHKRSVDPSPFREQIGFLGKRLGWHGALSADAIVSREGPLLIDINPRLVEPGNAWRAGVDLVSVLLDVASAKTPAAEPAGRPEVATHQLLLALLGAAQEGRGRMGVLAELLDAARHKGTYDRSTEELTPTAGDPRSAMPIVAAIVALMVQPASWRRFSSGSVASYALSPEGWREILSRSTD